MIRLVNSMLGAQNLAYDRDKAVADKTAIIEILILLGNLCSSFFASFS
jgi:hypothetical protein